MSLSFLRREIIAVPLFPLSLWLCTAASACKGCGASSDSLPTSSSSDAGGPATDASSNVPYAPSRSTPSAAPDAPLTIVEQALFKLRPELNECYREASKANPALRVSMTFTVAIGSDGKVTDVTPVGSPGPVDPALMECTTRALKSAKFQPPTDGKPTKVNVPIDYRPPRHPFRQTDGGRFQMKESE